MIHCRVTVKYKLAIVIIGGLLGPCALAQQNPPLGAGCEVINEPAQSSFDFTEEISRWGSRNSFEIDQRPYQVGAILINQLPIFDESNPDENNKLFRWANRIHIDTRPGVISNQLLFEPGDLVNSQVLAESERLLRNRKYVADTSLRVLRTCGDIVDVEVVTREVWTLTPNLSFSTSGGTSDFKIGVRDTNFLGTGQKFGVNYSKDSERDSYELSFENPDFRQRRRLVKARVADNSDGSQLHFQYAQPFYALDSRRAWNLSFEQTEEILTQYLWGEELTEVDHSHELAEVSWGISGGLRDGVTRRYSLGFRHEKQDYGPGVDRPSPLQLPLGVSLDYPFIGIERVEDNYAVAYNISQIYRTEDLHIGSQLVTSLGYDPGSGGTVVFNGTYRDTLLYRPKMLMQWKTDWYGRWDQRNGSWTDTVANLSVDFHRGQTDERTLYMGFEATKAINLNASQQVYLGGNNGLRGYDAHFLNGDSAVRFSIEERLFTQYHLLQLVRLGFAAFYDVGRVFGSREPGGNDIYQDVGVGLRFAPSKSDRGQVIHMDIAYPLNRRSPGGDSLQFVVELRESF